MTMMTGETTMPASDAADMTVRVSRIIHAPRDRVFQAWLDPKLRRQWWVTHGDGRLATCEIDARVDGRYRQSQIGGCDDEPDVDPNFEWIMYGEFVEIVEPERLVFTWNVNHDPPIVGNHVMIEFNEVAGGTEVVLTHEGLTTTQLRDGTQKGWTTLLGHMAELLERR